MIRMQAAKMYNRKIVHYVADDAKKRVNAAFLIGAYSVCLLLFLLLLLRQIRRQIRFVHVSSSWFVIHLQISASLSFSDTEFMSFFVLSVLWRCWLGGRKGIWPVKNRVVGYWHGVCLERGADLHMTQLMPLPLTVSCSSKIQIGFTFLVPAYPGCPGKEAVKWFLLVEFMSFFAPTK